MASRYKELPGTWGHKQPDGVRTGEVLVRWAQVAFLPVPALPCGCSGAQHCAEGLGVPHHCLWHVLKRQLLLAPCLQVHGQKAAWEDPVEWVRDTLPWPSAQQDQSKLYHLPPPTIGPHSTVSPPEEHSVKDTTPSSLDADPLVRPCWAGWCLRGRGRVELCFPSHFSG